MSKHRAAEEERGMMHCSDQLIAAFIGGIGVGAALAAFTFIVAFIFIRPPKKRGE